VSDGLQGLPVVTRNYFDGPVAERYDDDSADMFDPQVLGPTVDFLAELAAGGNALELGIGTGRVAVPLHGRGVPVHGIELSEAMADRLRAKPEAAGIDVTIGDFAAARAPGTYRLAYLVFNTIMNLTTQDAQVDCFRNVTEHLEPGGHFVLEVSVPDLRRLPPGETVRPFSVTAEHLGFDEYDIVDQGLVSHHYDLRDGGVRQASVPFRYVWPAELDLMARIAGMSPVARYAGWRRETFDAESRQHVSVWRKDD
jgi:SAM-dependent methyltransferase